MDVIARQAFALQPDQIESLEPGAVPPNKSIGNDVVRYSGYAADKGVSPNPAELLNGGKPTHIDAITHRDMTAERNAIGECHVIADVAIMGNMAVGHEITTVAHLCEPTALHRTAIHRDVLANDIVFAEYTPMLTEHSHIRRPH